VVVFAARQVDIEHSEWDAIPDVLDSVAAGQLRVGQLMMELHNQEPYFASRSPVPSMAERAREVQRMFEKADNAGLMLFSKEPNTLGCNGYSCGEWCAYLAPAFFLPLLFVTLFLYLLDSLFARL
jgi:hypothetical protein